ncbi:deoxyguanosinetriphosphate triphosphohydrolase [Sporichthya polymorpha]|uniref:deoxyguanosinetriphosphate triphosphohydrolase n=1 Tax=Sporichthya polymorpha TaxID=35751 RepID=UPI00037DEC5D|nr:deoxyguanosinetriphosphate triphosphohydrolase [Sporichthya polymorpha]
MDSEGYPAGYGAADAERWVAEPPKLTERTAFARDRARVLHSAALRRLAAKTQVVAPGTDDFARNRLTHSLEVGQIGRELGAWLGADADLVETACLAHDLGHPPFGHNGEDALDTAAFSCGGFEGNAQTLRVLTRLEGKTIRADGRSVGLNLTRAALDATVKYPWPRREGLRKFGHYPDDADAYAWLRAGARSGRRCLEAQVMDFADDVAYSVHDVEDGIQAGMIDLGALGSVGERADLAALAARNYLTDLDSAELDDAAATLTTLPWWPQSPDRTRRGLAALKNMTSQLISRFCLAAQAATRDHHGPGPLTRYAADLCVPRETQVEIALLKTVAARYVMHTEARETLQARERSVIAELVDALEAGAPDALDPAFAVDFTAAEDDAARRRVVLDQIASLSDTSALALHARLCR